MGYETGVPPSPLIIYIRKLLAMAIKLHPDILSYTKGHPTFQLFVYVDDILFLTKLTTS